MLGCLDARLGMFVMCNRGAQLADQWFCCRLLDNSKEEGAGGEYDEMIIVHVQHATSRIKGCLVKRILKRLWELRAPLVKHLQRSVNVRLRACCSRMSRSNTVSLTHDETRDPREFNVRAHAYAWRQRSAKISTCSLNHRRVHLRVVSWKRKSDRFIRYIWRPPHQHAGPPVHNVQRPKHSLASFVRGVSEGTVNDRYMNR